jgi:hypothetical protein
MVKSERKFRAAHAGSDRGPRIGDAASTRKRTWLLAGALASILLAVALLLRLAIDGHAAEPASVPSVSQAPLEPAPPRRAVQPRPVAEAAAPAAAQPRMDEAPVSDEPPEREDPPIGFGPPGEKTGIALFPPPGTKPTKRGILVPEGFELPPGYVRHYQATDDGQRVPAILMFSPDFEWLDESGEVIALPADRVVPAEMAPDGMPIQMLELPGDANQPERAP